MRNLVVLGDNETFDEISECYVLIATENGENKLDSGEYPKMLGPEGYLQKISIERLLEFFLKHQAELADAVLNNPKE